jgi:hypothetical protein
MWVGFVPGLILSGIGLSQVYASEWNAAYVMNIGANINLYRDSRLLLHYFLFINPLKFYPPLEMRRY